MPLRVKQPCLWKTCKAFWNTFGFWSGTKSIMHGARQFIRAKLTKPSWLSIARNEECSRCKLFNHTCQSCGTFGETWKPADGIVRTLGCWCHTPTANRLADKDCWAKFHGLDFGWADPLRPPRK